MKISEAIRMELDKRGLKGAKRFRAWLFLFVVTRVYYWQARLYQWRHRG